ncbi:hypothetical protein G6F64_014734 [Rhizopus arrhizus]|uniref:Uncharacterized protein n=1 Tax=Rhizopus oryzae TaxID=64495 RepID=A0A9P7BIN8_RHIOR|nr:hypothetical protein G6F64_014734 [Rhizopus arrhizus]
MAELPLRPAVPALPRPRVRAAVVAPSNARRAAVRPPDSGHHAFAAAPRAPVTAGARPGCCARAAGRRATTRWSRY